MSKRGMENSLPTLLITQATCWSTTITTMILLIVCCIPLHPCRFFYICLTLSTGVGMSAHFHDKYGRFLNYFFCICCVLRLLRIVSSCREIEPCFDGDRTQTRGVHRLAVCEKQQICWALKCYRHTQSCWHQFCQDSKAKQGELLVSEFCKN